MARKTKKFKARLKPVPGFSEAHPEIKARKITFGTIILLIVLFFILVFAISALKNAVTSKLLVIPIKGEISTSDQGLLFFVQEANVPTILSCLEKAEKDSTIKAVLLEINSPGGSVVGSSNVADKVIEVKAKKPVVAYIKEIGASGAYWIASVADKIIAEPYSMTGSIGVVASYLEYAGLLSNWNITYQRLVTGKYKDIANPEKELTAEEKNILLTKMKIIHQDFLNTVAKNRNLTEAQKAEVGNSLFYLGKEALQLGLVDEIGNEDQAKEIAKDMAHNKKLAIAKCEKKSTGLPFLKVISNFAYFLGKGIGSELFSLKPEQIVPVA